MIFEEKEYVIDDKKVILRSAKPSDAETMIQREYAIAVLTGYMNTDYYFYDQNAGYTEEDSTIPDPNTAVYYASADYENREIHIYSGIDTSKEPISTLGME